MLFVPRSVQHTKIPCDYNVELLNIKPCGGGPDSSVGIATDYGLDGPGSNPGGDEFFRPSRPTLGPIQPSVQWVLGLSRGRGGRGVGLTPI